VVFTNDRLHKDDQMGFLLIAPGNDKFGLLDYGCGADGRIGGLVIMARGEVLGTKAFDLDYMPHQPDPVGSSSELTIQVDTASTCLEYNNVELAAVSSCEWGMRNGLKLLKPLHTILTEDNQLDLTSGGQTRFDEVMGILQREHLCGGNDDAPVADQPGCAVPDAIGLNKGKTFSVEWEDASTKRRRLLAEQTSSISLAARVDQNIGHIQRGPAVQLPEDKRSRTDFNTRTEMLFFLGACTLLLAAVAWRTRQETEVHL